MVSYSALVLLNDPESKLISINLLLTLIIANTIAAFELFLPLALYITLLLGLGKLYSEHEISALQASGLSVFGLMRCLLPLIVVITILTAIVSIFVRPWAYDLRYSAKYQAEQTIDFEQLEEGYFYQNQDSDQVYFVRSIDHEYGIKKDIFIYQPGDESTNIVYAQKGRSLQAGDQLSPNLEFINGSALHFNKTGVDSLVKYKQFIYKPKTKQIAPPSFKTKAASTEYLAASQDKDEQAEFQWRVTSPVKAFLLALIAVLLAKTSPRQGKYGKLVMGILLFFVIHGASLVIKTWIEQGSFNPIPGLWSIIIALVIFSAALAKRHS